MAAGYEVTIADVATQKEFQAALADAGLAGITWPTPWGQGLTPEHQRVFNEESAGYALPTTAYVTAPTRVPASSATNPASCSGSS